MKFVKRTQVNTPKTASNNYSNNNYSKAKYQSKTQNTPVTQEEILNEILNELTIIRKELSTIRYRLAVYNKDLDKTISVAELIEQLQVMLLPEQEQTWKK